jgi:hypothetical protein
MRHIATALLLAAAPVSIAVAHQAAAPALPSASKPVPKEQLLVPPANADHYVVVSESAKHGDIWTWTLPDGSRAYRHSQSLRGWITETDAVVRANAKGLPQSVTIRGVTPDGDAAETFTISPEGTARWQAVADSGTAPAGSAYYLSTGGPPIMDATLISLLTKSADSGVPLLPTGRAFLDRGPSATVSGPRGTRQVQLGFIRGIGMSPWPVWTDDKGDFWGSVGWISVVPAGYEANAKALRDIQEKATAESVKSVAAQFLTPAARAPVLFQGVQLFDADRGRFLNNQSVLVQDGKIAAAGAAGLVKAPQGTAVIDGRGKTLVPGLWDAHRHIGGDWSLVSNMAAGMTSFRSPGTMIDRAQSVAKRRASGELLVGEGWVQAIVDRKDPLAAQGALTVSSAEETIAAVRKVKDAGLWGVKFYTSMNPEWIAPGAAEAKKLGLHVNGHVPATMRPLEAVRAGYDELTHINFVVMQLMPKSVVDKANTAARIEGPAKYAKDLNLRSAEARAMFSELARRKTYVDPTLVVFEQALTAEGGTPVPAYSPYAHVVPPLVARGFRSGGHPLIENLTRADYRRSFAKLVELTGALHKAGVPIVAGTDGEGMELVRELELYRQAGMTNAQALRTATIVPAQLVGADKRTGSIAVGKEADLVLVDGDVSRELGALRRVVTVVSDGYVMDADALRKSAGYTGRPK